MTDWLNSKLDTLPKENVPAGFAERVCERIEFEDSRQEQDRPQGLLLFGRFSRLAAGAAAAILLLVTGFWAGQGAPTLHQRFLSNAPGETARLDLSELYANRETLEAWELLVAEDLDLGFADATAGTYLLEQVATFEE